MAVTNFGSDMAQMARQVIERTGCTPGHWLVDGGFPSHEQIDAVHEHNDGNTEVIAPVPQPRKAKTEGNDELTLDKHHRKDRDCEPVAQRRSRMGQDDAKDVYKQRAASAECVNALARNRGLSKVRAVAYLYALADNLMRMAKIAPQLISRGTAASASALAAE